MTKPFLTRLSLAAACFTAKFVLTDYQQNKNKNPNQLRQDLACPFAPPAPFPVSRHISARGLNSHAPCFVCTVPVPRPGQTKKHFRRAQLLVSTSIICPMLPASLKGVLWHDPAPRETLTFLARAFTLTPLLSQDFLKTPASKPTLQGRTFLGDLQHPNTHLTQRAPRSQALS